MHEPTLGSEGISGVGLVPVPPLEGGLCWMVPPHPCLQDRGLQPPWEWQCDTVSDRVTL